jgi:starvation-inducible DNA-binding protein
MVGNRKRAIACFGRYICVVKGHEHVATTARKLFSVAAEANDQPTADLLTQRLEVREKTAWMLRSRVDEPA